jgi:microcystin-dependent protein
MQQRAGDGLGIVSAATQLCVAMGQAGGLMEPFVGQIIPVAFNFTPYGWLACNGQTVAISNYSVLYQLIGTSYGGDGQNTFGIPNLGGRAPLHIGQGVGLGGVVLSNYTLGEMIGTEEVTLLSTQVGQHSHAFMTSTKAANSITPSTSTALGVASSGTGGIHVYGPVPSTTTNLSANTVDFVGGSQPHENRQPFQAVNFIIAWAGIYPSQ